MVKTKKKIGRPLLITEKVLSKLEEGFSMGFTDEEACLYAGIGPNTLYRYIEKNPDFGKRKEILKRQPNIKSKINITKEIGTGNTDLSKWWLERKAKEEFSIQKEVKLEQIESIDESELED